MFEVEGILNVQIKGEIYKWTRKYKRELEKIRENYLFVPKTVASKIAAVIKVPRERQEKFVKNSSLSKSRKRYKLFPKVYKSGTILVTLIHITTGDIVSKATLKSASGGQSRVV